MTFSLAVIALLTVNGTSASPSVRPSAWPDADWTVLDSKVRWAVERRLDTLPLGQAIARLGETFVGTRYTPNTLEVPGPERVVINLQEFDCVSFIENMLAMTRFIRADGVAGLADRAAAEQKYAAYIREIRYRSGRLDGYPSRLHYFSEWLSDNADRGRLRLMARELGGAEDREPLSFMSAHRSAYKAMSQLGVPTAIRAMEKRLNAGGPRWYIPEARIDAAAAGIQDGDLIAATSTLAGLDVAHTGLALWKDGKLHLLHAPLVGKEVEISSVPLAERILGIRTQDGIMVARVEKP